MPKSAPSPKTGSRVSLKTLGDYLGLSPSTVSSVLNNTPGRGIAEETRERVRKAAERFNYKPSFIGRTLQGKPMRAIGIMLPILGEAYHAQIVSGAGNLLMERDYDYFTVHHRYNAERIRDLPNLLQARGVDGILALDTLLTDPLPVPTVMVAGQSGLPNVTNVALNHALAARLALGHLHELGHKRIVFMKGQQFSADTLLRWSATVQAARELGIEVQPRLTVELDIDSTSPEIGYPGIHNLIRESRKSRAHGRPDFTAILCFNDLSAIGTIRALYDAGLRVPQDVSVVGYDDVEAAPFHVPSLTTIRQPLQEMGTIGADALLRKIAGETLPSIISIEPQLVIRESAAPPAQ